MRKGSDERKGEDHTDDMSTDLEPKREKEGRCSRSKTALSWPCVSLLGVQHLSDETQVWVV